MSDHRLIFIVGIPRSGTTWLLNILSAHPDCRELTPQMLGIDPPLLKTGEPSRETGLFIRSWSKEEILTKVAALPDDKVLVEKTPGHLTELSRVRRLFPKAKIVLITRNRANVQRSIQRASENLWIRAIQHIPGYYGLLYGWQQRFSDYDHIVQYEQLEYHPEAEKRKLFKALGLSDPRVFHARGDPDTLRIEGNVEIDSTATVWTHDQPSSFVTRYDGKITIGANTFVNCGAWVRAEEAVTIGRGCLIGPQVMIMDNDAHGKRPPSPVTIGDSAWLGARVTVLKGITIGENTTVGAGSVVTSDVPVGATVAGNPARAVK